MIKWLPRQQSAPVLRAFHPMTLGVMHDGQIIRRSKCGKFVRFRFIIDGRVYTLPIDHVQEY